MKKRVIITLVAFAAATPLLGTASCGDDSGTGVDGAIDVTLDNVLPDGGGDSPFGDSPTTNDGNAPDVSCWTNCSNDGGPITCLNLAASCKSSGDCCSKNCYAGSCQPPLCTPDNNACSSNGECCSKKCGSNGTCTPLNTTCKTLGNPCNSGADCCSTFCQNKVCAEPSYCVQNGDICASSGDCCGGLCNIAQGATFGTCAQPPQQGAQCKAVDGVVCLATDAGIIDGGLPACGGDCCSRACAPWGPTQVYICQPASGCHPVGDICYKDSDCCGSSTGVTTCNQADAGVAGVCSNPTGCKPNGDICKLWSQTCNADNNCCSRITPTKGPDDLGCHQDNLGVPRCSYAGDAGNCVPSTGSCATSADCCNLNPCVPDQDGGLTCYPSVCVPTTGPCTSNADCCVGGQCFIAPGATSGTCQGLTTIDGGTPDSGTPPCALYGQTCVTAADCCNGVPCTSGRCEYPVQ